MPTKRGKSAKSNKSHKTNKSKSSNKSKKSASRPHPPLKENDHPALLAYPAHSYAIDQAQVDVERLRALFVNQSRVATFPSVQDLLVIVYNATLDAESTMTAFSISMPWSIAISTLNDAIAKWLAATFPRVIMFGLWCTRLDPSIEKIVAKSVGALLLLYHRPMQGLTMTTAAGGIAGAFLATAAVRPTYNGLKVLVILTSENAPQACWTSIKQYKYREPEANYFKNLSKVLGHTSDLAIMNLSEPPLDCIKHLSSAFSSDQQQRQGPVKLLLVLSGPITGTDLQALRFLNHQNPIVKNTIQLYVYACSPKNGCDLRAYDKAKPLLDTLVDKFRSLIILTLHAGPGLTMAQILASLAPLRTTLAKLTLALHSRDQMPDRRQTSLPAGVSSFPTLAEMEIVLLRGRGHDGLAWNSQMMDRLLSNRTRLVTIKCIYLHCDTCGFRAEAVGGGPSTPSQTTVHCQVQVIRPNGGNVVIQVDTS